RPFADLGDFARRIDPRTVGRRTLESLAAAGAFDCLEPDRARVFAAIDSILATASRAREASELGQSELFGGPAASFELPAAEPWNPEERLSREHGAIGFYLSAHPLDGYVGLLERMRVQMWADFQAAVRRGAVAGRLAGTITQRVERKTRTG